ncbi:hypothetical protein [Sphingomonas montanisoli]|uniref:DUF3040 domain-containing protein n=1 Tax=Sphingomonas montanisoli TaxID=2606412 RepID=A0A5D9C6Z4_9SPHN|nr:hypothetical protein [Sphingomonas montanisoli]TZG27236.1 hypothetical protein FYJ91_06330 [Sphingomonas montanisoli]
MAEPPFTAEQEARIRAIIEEARRDEWADAYVVPDDLAAIRDLPAYPPETGWAGVMRLVVAVIAIGGVAIVGARAMGF